MPIQPPSSASEYGRALATIFGRESLKKSITKSDPDIAINVHAMWNINTRIHNAGLMDGAEVPFAVDFVHQRATRNPSFGLGWYNFVLYDMLNDLLVEDGFIESQVADLC